MARQMKDSGIEWIGEIPETWEIRKHKTLFDCSKEIVGETSAITQLLSLTTHGIRKKGQEVSAGKVPESFDTYQTVAPDDIVMCLFDLDCSAVFSGISPYQGMISPAYKVLKCKGEIIPLFADYWFKFVFDGRKFRTYAKNLRYTLTYDEFAMLSLALPSLVEQGRIAAFLDRKCAEIDAVIERTKATIEEYKKLKQAVITEAVTKGVRGPRPMKDSGIEWIGEIPEGWAVRKLGRFISIRSGITLGKTYPQDAELVEMPYLRVANVKADGFALDDVATIEVTPEEAEKFALKAGELLMTEGGDRDKLGRGTIWHGEIAPCLHQNHVFAATCDETWLLTQYLAYLTASNVGRQYFDITAKKTTNLACTNSNTILQFKIPLPSTEEQQEIIEWLPIRCSALDTLIAKKTALLAELETYKKSLIYEYVTGKKEVL